MKNVLIGVFTAILLGLTSCGWDSDQTQLSPDLVKNPATASSEESDVALAVMEFETAHMQFGSIVQGESVKKDYYFTNTGSVDLIISSANGSCGCTVPKWPRSPIKPGQKEKIEVVFNSQGKSGEQKVKVYIMANTSPVTSILRLTGEVVAPE